MLKIETGRAIDNGIKFWEIVDDEGTHLTKFSSVRFSHIENQHLVYFMDLNLDPRQCENVQTVADVDGRIGRATPPKGIDKNAERELRLYVMTALLKAIERSGRSRSAYLARLDELLDNLARLAASREQSLSLDLLREAGIIM